MSTPPTLLMGYDTPIPFLSLQQASLLLELQARRKHFDIDPENPFPSPIPFPSPTLLSFYNTLMGGMKERVRPRGCWWRWAVELWCWLGRCRCRRRRARHCATTWLSAAAVQRRSTWTGVARPASRAVDSQTHRSTPTSSARLHTTNAHLYTRWQWRHFVPYVRQLVSAAILWVKLLEMFVTLVSLKYALSAGWWSCGHFPQLTG